jgi:hypothetical protein
MFSNGAMMGPARRGGKRREGDAAAGWNMGVAKASAFPAHSRDETTID